MGCRFDKWTVLKIFEVGFTIACLVCKTVTDYESRRLFLYLEKISREWSLLNNITWNRIGSAVADATYGGYVIITIGLLIGYVIGEIPTKWRITELILLGVGAILFIAMGSLEFASLDQVPTNLLDNAAVCGALSLVTAFLFLADMGGPRRKKETPKKTNEVEIISQPQRQVQQHAVNVEQPVLVRVEAKKLDAEKGKVKKVNNKKAEKEERNGSVKNVQANGYKKMKDKEKEPVDRTKRFGIYGRDAEEYVIGGNHFDDDHDSSTRATRHSPVWSNVRRGQYDIVTPNFHYPQSEPDYDERPPSGPGDPGFVQYAAQRWEQHAHAQKTPRQSPTQV